MSLRILSCLSLLAHCLGREKTSQIINPRIVIVGAGASGIAAASKLFENGFKNVTILEAEDRIGGRVHTTQFGDYFVDLGGQWIHGETGNVAFELVQPYDLIDKSDSKVLYGIVQEFFDSAGVALSDSILQNITNFYLEFISEVGSSNVTTYKSFGDYAEKMFEEYFKNTPEIFKDKRKYLHYLELFKISAESAETWHDIPVFENNHYQEYPGDQLINWKIHGYSKILDILMKRYPNPKEELPVTRNIKLKSEVMSIDYLENSKGAPVLVSTANGRIYEADHVIVTVSLGVLKKNHKSLFIPPLPDYKVETIEGLGFGDVAKIYLLFEKPFWTLGTKRILYFTFVWNDKEREMIENDAERAWLLGMTGAMTVEHKPNLLEFWITGKFVRVMETLSDGKVFNHTMENLHRFLDKKMNVTKPLAMLRTRWLSNPHFRGTYTYRSIGTQKKKVSSEMLEKPINPQNLTILFAGEATSKHRFSTVDGAISSGWKSANRLLNHYKKLLPLTTTDG